MMVILKIPIAYVCLVVYWAIRAEPRPFEGAALPVPEEPGPPGRWSPRNARRRRPGPHGSPARTPGARRAPVRAPSSR